VDIDGDGDLDLFVQERSDDLIFLENVGSPGAPEYRWRTDAYQGLEVGAWSRFADVDGDGDADLLAEERFSHIRLYRNEGTPQTPRFVLAADTIRDDDGAPIFSDRQNIPNAVDMDCDGLVDLFLGRVDGTVVHYEEMARDSAGVPRFVLRDERFQGIEIVAQIGGQPVGASLHGANSMAFADVNGDGAPDFFWGDFFEPSVLFIQNAGPCANPNLRAEPRPVATVEDDSLLTSGYNAPVPVDIDADGDVDLAVGVLGGAFNPNRTASSNFQVWIRGEDGRLRKESTRYLDQVDVGSESAPALGDLDGDGDLDLLVGNKLDALDLTSSRVYRFENRGTPSAPELHLVDTLALGDAYRYAPTLGDLDDDGDPDLVLGTWNDDVLLYENVGTAEEARFEARTEALVELTRGSYSTPALGDVDGDGDLDLMVGEASGELNFYRNDGSPSAPDFQLVSDTFQEIDVGSRSHPAFVDVNGDGALDLVVGREALDARIFLGDGTGAFEPAPGRALPLLPVGAPAFGDLDGDGSPEVVAGHLGGGLVYYDRRERR
jgi:hypothetical protein